VSLLTEELPIIPLAGQEQQLLHGIKNASEWSVACAPAAAEERVP
jgi:hypothetical protein